jgi:hypothetical protein
MSAAIEQSLSSAIDGMTGEAVCHLFPSAASTRSFCGVPRDEQAHHGQVKVRAARCNHCGLPRCGACRARVVAV